MKKITSLISHLSGRRGVLLIATVLFAVGWWLFRGEPIATLFAAVVLILGSGLVLLLSLAISEVHKDVARLNRGVAEPAILEDLGAERPDLETVEQHKLAQSLSSLNQESRTLEFGASPPSITVVVPCFNEERFIAEAIDSIKQQSYEDFECIVVDDASTDGSLAVIWKSIADDDRFRVIRHRSNGGLSASRNTGLREARGELVTFMDGDDLLLQDSLLDRYVAFATHRSDPHVVGAYCGVINAPEDAQLSEFPPRHEWGTRWKDQRVIDLVTAKGECPFSAHSPLLRTEHLRLLGGFDESLTSGGEDWDLWLRIMRNGYVFVPSRYRSAVYRQKLGSMIRAGVADHAEVSAALIRNAHRPAEIAAMTHPSPTPMTRPLAHYEEGVTLAARLLRFAATALARGQPQGAQQILGNLPDLSETIVRRHVDVDRQFLRGVERALGYTGSNSEVIEQASLSMRAEFDQLISSAFGEPEPVSQPPPSTIDILLVPQHKGHLRRMLEFIPQVSTGGIAVLNLDRESGDQGVNEDVPEGLEIVTLNRLALKSTRVRHALVGAVRDGTVESVAQSLVDQGALVTEVPSDLDEITRVDAAHPRLELPSTGPGAPEESGNGIWAPWPSDPIDLDWEALIEEENPETSFDAGKLAALKNKYRGERAVIIGNGPSLNALDLALLKNEMTFAVNAIFLAQDQMGFDPTFYVVEDTAVMADNLERIKAYKAGHKFFPSIYRHLIGEDPNVTYFMMNRGFYSASSPNFCVPRFATDVSQQIFCGQSVTIINLQLAFHMGFREVILIGMDFSYVIPDDADVEGNLITSQSDDPNHFHPEYFGQGKVWKDPKLDRVLASYALAKNVFEADGRRIINASAGGKLELFDRADYEQLFG